MQIDSAISRENAKRVPRWNGQVRFVEEALLQPLRWKRPRRIFVNSMSDLFHENVTDEMRDRIFAVMALCREHTFIVLTKRPERMREYLHHVDVRHRISSVLDAMEAADPSLKERGAWRETLKDVDGVYRQFLHNWPMRHLQVGVSIEDQKTADERVTILRWTRLATRIVSAEPLLGPLDLSPYLKLSGHIDVESGAMYVLPGIRGVIVGGESGPRARPMHPDWVRSLRDQCVDAGVPFFFKQWGEWRPPLEGETFTTARGQAQRVPAFIIAADGSVHCFHNQHTQHGSAPMLRVGKKAAGNLLDGQQWLQMPEVRA
jgi:protein gp37